MTFKNIVWHELVHFFVALLVSSFLFWELRSVGIVLLVFSITFLLDLDHLFDYYYFARNLSFWNYFSGANIFIVSQKVFVLAHSWELVIILCGIGISIRSAPLWGITLSLAGHLLVDQLSYKPNLRGYFLLFRLKNGFARSWFTGGHKYK